jgi:hypothetical protein
MKLSRTMAALLLTVTMSSVAGGRPEMGEFATDAAAGREFKAYAASRPAYLSIGPALGKDAARDAGVERSFRVVLHKPAGTDSALPAAATVFTGIDPGNGQNTSGNGVAASAGVAFARGWRPMVSSPRGTAISPGSCLVVQVEPSRDRFYLLEGDSATVWLDAKPQEVVTLAPRRYVEIVRAGRDAFDFVRDERGVPRQFDVDAESEGMRIRDMIDYTSIP